MRSSGNARADQTHAMMQDLADHWGLVVVMGIASILLGLLAIVFPGATIVTVALYFAAWLFISGIFSVVSSFTRDGDTVSRVLTAIIGVLSVIVGFALLRTPFQSVEVFIFVLGIFWLVQGIMTFVAAFALKRGRGWALVSGILGILAGIIILVYPISSAVTLAFVGGIWLVILGVIQVIAGLELRSLGSRPAATTTTYDRPTSAV
ncbi:MAG TPA: HdeD family acid-resistance protein [Candidatus Limnocylindrales bacterium]